MNDPANVLMEREGVQTEVANNESVQIMQGLGWEVVEAESGSMTAKDMRAALDAKGIAYKASASKAELQALLEANH